MTTAKVGAEVRARQKRSDTAKGKRWERLTVQVRPAEKQAVEAQAAAMGITPHALMRRAILNMVQEIPDSGKADLERLDAAASLVRSTGVLLNQIARAANRGKNVAVADELLSEVRSVVENSRDAMRTVVAMARARSLRRIGDGEEN